MYGCIPHVVYIYSCYSSIGYIVCEVSIDDGYARSEENGAMYPLMSVYFSLSTHFVHS